MTYPVPAVGTRLTADFLTSMLEISARKTGSTARTSTTVLANDPDLTLAVEANAVYEIRMGLKFTGAVAGGLSFAFSMPAGAAGDTMVSAPRSGGAGGFNEDQMLASTMSGTVGTDAITGGLAGGVILLGTFTTSGTAGNVALQWAQRVSNGTATTMLAGSYLMFKRIG